MEHKILKKVNSDKRLSLALVIASHGVVIASAFVYSFFLYRCFALSKILFIKAVAVTAIPFLLVSVMRCLINAKRPYELYDFYDVPPKNKRGHSFPGRHAFSAFLIATVAFPLVPWVSVALGGLGILLCIARVLLGVHFVRDVVAGALIGIASGVIGIFSIGLNPV